MGEPNVDEIEIAAGAKAIVLRYGGAIGENQARNIAYTVLTAARGAKSEQERAQIDDGSRGPITDTELRDAVAVKELRTKYAGLPPKGLNNIPQEKRQAFLAELDALSAKVAA